MLKLDSRSVIVQITRGVVDFADLWNNNMIVICEINIQH